jgi:hypothetical protein
MLRFASFLYDSTPLGVAMSSPIGFREFSEDDYRKFIRTAFCAAMSLHRCPARSIDSR